MGVKKKAKHQEGLKSITAYPDDCCIYCGTKRKYNKEFDVYFCKKCDYWLEKICPDKKCQFCSKRPKYPSGAKLC